MKVLLAFNLHAYGKPERGLSYEYYNLFLPLQKVADEVLLFDFAGLQQEHGQQGMNRRLLEILRSERPDVAIFALFMEEYFPETIAQARQFTRTVAYFFDDIWRTGYVARWAPRFDHFTTAIWSRYRHYQATGLPGAIYSPFAYNEELYRPREVPLRHDVTFVGGAHPWRSFVVDRLRRAGFQVSTWGPFWASGKLEQEEMIKVFSASRINLNLSNARQWDARYLLSSWRALRNTLRRPKGVEAKVRDGIKGRHFEIAGCGGFQLTYYCEDLERHYRIGDEVAVYLDLEDLIEKVRYYLENEGERGRIATAGYERAVREHTATRRLTDLLQTVMRGEPAEVIAAETTVRTPTQG